MDTRRISYSCRKIYQGNDALGSDGYIPKSPWIRHGYNMGVEPKIGVVFTPKMDGENNGNPYKMGNFIMDTPIRWFIWGAHPCL